MVPLFIICQRKACEAVVTVKNTYEQRRRRYCSHRCAALAHHPLTPEAGRKGGRQKGHRARLAIRLKVETLPALEAFRDGYRLGLASKHRQVSRRAVGRPRVGAEGEGKGREELSAPSTAPTTQVPQP